MKKLKREQTTMKRVLVTVLLACAALQAQDAGHSGSDYANGRDWITLNTVGRRIYLKGMTDGQVYHSVFDPRDPNVPKPDETPYNEGTYWPKGRSINKVITELNRFYAEPRNRPISIPDAVWLIGRQLDGESPLLIQRLLEIYRKNP
jgi:hypothetical protein